jgi:hypothetical protein
MVSMHPFREGGFDGVQIRFFPEAAAPVVDINGNNPFTPETSSQIEVGAKAICSVANCDDTGAVRY